MIPVKFGNCRNFFKYKFNNKFSITKTAFIHKKGKSTKKEKRIEGTKH